MDYSYMWIPLVICSTAESFTLRKKNLRENQDTAGCRQNFPYTIRGEFMISMYRAEILMKAYVNKICHKALWAVRGRPERELRLTATLCINTVEYFPGDCCSYKHVGGQHLRCRVKCPCSNRHITDHVHVLREITH